MVLLAIFAAAACALCNGTAAVLQKMGADREARSRSLDVGLLVKLLGNAPYFWGIVLDLLGWILTVFAVRFLPLFLVQSVIAANVAVTALLEKYWQHHSLKRHGARSVAVLLGGLILLAITATPEHAVQVHGVLAAAIIFAPLGLALLGTLVARSNRPRSAGALAGLSGLAFGGTSIVGRVLPFDRPLWHVLYNPFLLALAAYGLVGILLFTLALQRGRATLANAAMTVTQTLVPTIIGLVYLGDSVRSGLWLAMVVGATCAVVGSAGVALAAE